MKGYFPEHGIDHKDRIKTNNKWSNLKEKTTSCNVRNQSAPHTNKSGVKGVALHNRPPEKGGKTWRVLIFVNGKQKHLGSKSDLVEAVALRLASEQCLNWHECDEDSSAYNFIQNYLKEVNKQQV